MCGICGIVYDDPSRPLNALRLRKMNSSIAYRGPDDEGYYIGKAAGLAMRRLAIIDLVGGHQPFSSEEGDVVAICNGEIYNYKELRADLHSRGHFLHSRSDPEVIPHLYEERGKDFVKSLDGMFALALWNERARELVLARDIMGKKPLYYTYQNGVFAFASEIKALLANDEISANIDRSALAKYLACEYVPAPLSIFKEIKKLEPACALVFKNGEVSTYRYWSLPFESGSVQVRQDEAAEKICFLLSKSVKKRLVSDVPLGVFLSGGLDSSAVLAMMTAHREAREIKSFSIAFDEKSYDESHFARLVASQFGTAHQERRLGPRDMLTLIPSVVDLMDEPLADPSILPTYALSKFAREQVTVALGGDGGDELFAGYPTFQADVVADALDHIPSAVVLPFLAWISRLLPASDVNMSARFKLTQFCRGLYAKSSTRHPLWLGSFTPAQLQSLFASPYDGNAFEEAEAHYEAASGFSHGNRLLYQYMRSYLGDQVLTKVDRASMWCSLEVRSPFLDREVVEYACSLPYCLKLKGQKTKYVLKKALAQLFPARITGRRKKGFGIPVSGWIKGPLREMAYDLLSPSKIAREGFFKPRYVVDILESHMSKRADNRKQIWTLLVFENWLSKYGSSRSPL